MAFNRTKSVTAVWALQQRLHSANLVLHRAPEKKVPSDLLLGLPELAH